VGSDLLSDRRRPVLVGLAASGVAAALSIWTWLSLTGRIGYLGLDLDPAALDGVDVVLTLVAVGPPEAPDRFVVYQGAQPIEIIGSSADLREGEDVTLGGTFSAAEDGVVMEWLEHAPDRGRKKAIGGLSLAFVICALPFWFRWDRGLAIRG
jgi:hypothetical protein